MSSEKGASNCSISEEPSKATNMVAYRFLLLLAFVAVFTGATTQSPTSKSPTAAPVTTPAEESSSAIVALVAGLGGSFVGVACYYLYIKHKKNKVLLPFVTFCFNAFSHLTTQPTPFTGAGRPECVSWGPALTIFMRACTLLSKQHVFRWLLGKCRLFQLFAFFLDHIRKHHQCSRQKKGKHPRVIKKPKHLITCLRNHQWPTTCTPTVHHALLHG